MSEDATIVESVKIPGMQIASKIPLSPDGKELNFVTFVDALIPLEALNERLDVIAKAGRRQAAIEELPIVKQSLAANLKLLAKEIEARAHAAAALDIKLRVVGGNRRNPDATRHAPQDVNALAQHDNRITQIRGQIEGTRQRIPYLESIIAGEEPPEIADDEDAANDRSLAAAE